MISFDFSDKHVVVVGGTSGINRGIARAFAAQGARVVVASRSLEKVNDTVRELEALGAKAWGFNADVRDYDAIEAGFGQAGDKYGDIDVLISGAAGNFPALANSMSANAFKSVVDIDLLGTFNVLRASFPHLKKPGASVINISAPQAQLAMVGQSHVCAAKAGVDMITKSLSMEWGCDGVRVNSIIPGPIAGTEGMKRLAPTQEMMEACRQSVSLKRIGQPEDIANTALFLSSSMASFISGAIIPVDGGWVNGGAAAMGVAMEGMLRKLSQK